MKKMLVAVLVLVATLSLAGCSMGTETADTTTVNPSQEYHDSLTSTADDAVESSEPVNYMDEIKEEVHDELFREETEETLDIVDRIFKHLKIEVVGSHVDGDDAVVTMQITTINAGRAWVRGLEKYAILCAENLFSETYASDATLYSCYLEEFEDAVREAEYINILVDVEMRYKNHRWVWDIDDDVINGVTGFLLAAIEGDVNSDTIWIEESIKEEPESPIVDSQATTAGMNAAVERAELCLSIFGYSRAELYEILEEAGFVEDEILYALGAVGY